MDAREEMRRWLALLVQMADESESKTIKQDADMLLAVASELTGKLAARNTALAKQIRPRSTKPPKASPANGPQKPEQPQSSSTPRAPRMMLRTVLRRFHQFSREFVRLIPRWSINSELCGARSMALRTMMWRLAKRRRHWRDERGAA
jgi:hypothetical protein